MSYGVGLRNGVAFALGTIPSLTSGGGLRPSLLLNFLSGTLDSRITFSRGTQATQYTSNGTLQYAPNNLLTYSNQFDNAAWTKSNSFVQTNLLTFSDAAVANYVSITAPVVNTTPIVGFTNSVYFPYTPAGNIVAYKSYTVTINTLYTISAYVQMDDNSAPVLSSSSLSGDLTLVVDNNPAPLNLTVTSVGSGVYRVSAGYTTAAFSGTNIGVVKYNTQSAKGFKVTGLQLVQGSVPGDYVATTSAALPVLYADYQGKLRARKLCESNANSTHSVSQGITTTATPYTFSVYAKQPSDGSARRYFLVYHSQSNAGWVFDLQTGTLGVGGTTGVSAPVSYAITSVGNGWYRCQITVNATAASNSFLHYLVDNNGSGGSVYTGDGSSGIYIADAQLEAGSTVQAYNDTTSAAYYGPRFDYDPTNYVRQNLLLQSQTFDNASWITSEATIVANTDIAPDGTLTADKFIPSTTPAVVHTLRQSITVTGGAFSIYAKAAGETTFSLWFVAAGQGVLFDLAAGTTSTISGGISSTITNVGNGWYRCTGAFTGATTLAHIYGRNGSGFAGDGTSGVLFWGAQLNTGSTALTYTATTTAPYTLVAARGLLIEEQRTNLLLYSDQFDNAAWTKTRCSITANNATSPEGIANADKLVEDGTAASTHPISQAVTVTAAAQTASCYLKAAERTWAQINLTGTVNAFANFNLATGAIGTVGAAATATVTASGNGWYRCTITSTTAAGANTFAIYPATGDNVISYNGDGVSGLYVYGSQLE